MPYKAPLRIAALAFTALFLTSCSSDLGEDPRPRLCKAMIKTLLIEPKLVTWTSEHMEHARFKDLETQIGFEVDYTDGAKSGPLSATCYYEWDQTVEEDVNTDTNPLLMYHSQPARIVFAGREVPKPILLGAIKAATINELREGSGRLQQGAQAALESFKADLGKLTR